MGTLCSHCQIKSCLEKNGKCKEKQPVIGCDKEKGGENCLLGDCPGKKIGVCVSRTIPITQAFLPKQHQTCQKILEIMSEKGM